MPYELLPIIFWGGVIAIFVYFKIYRPRKKEQAEKAEREAEQLAYQQQRNRIRLKIREEMKCGYTLRQCSKIIDAYSKMNKDGLFNMVGNILVVVSEPHDIRSFQGHKMASDEPIKVIFDAYYDNWHLRGLLKGNSPFDTSDAFDGIKKYHGIPQFLADNYGVPQILVDEKVSVTLEELKIKWSISVDPAVGLYGSYNDVGFRERFEIFSNLLKSRYPNLNNLIITFLR
ncbi:MAG: hypothetical protein K2O11_12015 [Oscillospiraceae bacterium]|nr:hypothetical protein [Oscillospiraceae bacterium]